MNSLSTWWVFISILNGFPFVVLTRIHCFAYIQILLYTIEQELSLFFCLSACMSVCLLVCLSCVSDAIAFLYRVFCCADCFVQSDLKFQGFLNHSYSGWQPTPSRPSIPSQLLSILTPVVLLSFRKVLTLWQPDWASHGQPPWFNAALVNKLMPCTWRLRWGVVAQCLAPRRLQVLIPLLLPRRDLWQVVQSQLPVAPRRANSDTASML